jgi:hypothetical protein
MKITKKDLRKLILEATDPKLRGDYNYHAFADFWADHYGVHYEITHKAIAENDFSEISKIIARKGTVTPILDNYLEYFTGIEGLGYNSTVQTMNTVSPAMSSTLKLFKQHKLAEEIYILVLSELISILFEAIEGGYSPYFSKPVGK